MRGNVRKAGLVPKATSSDSDQTSSRQLLVDLAGVPRGNWGAELEASLRAAVRSGRLRPGARLPSTRALAADLGMSRSVVSQAYEQLAAEGYLVTRQGAAAQVSNIGHTLRRSASGVQSPPRGGGPIAGPAVDVDFRPGTPNLAGLPRGDWERAVRRSLATLTDAELGYGDSRGLGALREAIADYLGRVRGAAVDPDHVVVVNGFAQGLVVVTRLLADLGIGALGFEDPGSANLGAHLVDHGVALLPVPVDDDGIDPDAPGPEAAALRAVLVTPAHQFPTGVVLAPERRRRLVQWAERHDGLIVEDDYDAEYRYDRHAVGTLQGMAPDRVILGGSVSKTLAPGLRLGWLVVPPDLAASAASYKRSLDIMTPVLEQAAFCELLTSGAYERHVRRSRPGYRRRRDLMVEQLAAELPDAEVEGAAAGLHLLVMAPPTGCGDAAAVEAAVTAETARHGVLVEPLGRHRHAPGPPGFVLGYGHLGERQLRRGLSVFAAAVRATEPAESS
jgi:GntR family transcriptional regulator / MocR family aminotransferase